MIALPAALGSPVLDPPLDPSGEDGRGQLARELARPEYHETDLVQRVLDWLQRVFDDGVGRISGSGPITWFVATAVLVGIALGVVLLVSRARRTARTRTGRSAPALTGEPVTAAELRARAERALAEGRPGDAVVDGFRALAVRQVERGRIEGLPEATAHELAGALGASFAPHRDRIFVAADTFDAVLYGDHPADHEQAAAVLRLDDELAGRMARR